MLKSTIKKLRSLGSCVSKRIPKPKTKNQKIVFMVVFLLLSSALLSGIIFVLADLAGYGDSGPTAAPNSLDYGLVGYWNFEEGSGQTVYDRSGNGNNGTLGASSAVGIDDPIFGLGHDSSGEVGTGVKMDGVDDYVSVGAGANLSSTTAFSVSSWIKPDQLTTTSRPWFGKIDASFNGILTRITSPWQTSVYYYIKIGGVQREGSAGFSLQANKWNHLVETYDSSTHLIKFYLDGELKYSSALPSPYVLDDYSVANLNFGAYGAERFNGSMDEFRFYNRAISVDEVNLLYNNKRPALEINMDENAGTAVLDSSFGNYDGTVYGATGTAESGDSTTLTDTNKSWTTNEWANETIYITSGTGSGQNRTVASNTATAVTVSSAWATNPDATSVYSITSKDEWTSGKDGSAVDFDGADDYVDLGDIFRPSRTTGRSFSFWVYPDSINNRTVFSTGNLYNTKAGFSEFILTSSGVLVSYDFNISPYAFTFPVLADVGQWNHFILTVDVSDSTNTELKLYKNGKFISSMTQERTASGAFNKSFLIGARYSGASALKDLVFDGKIDKFRIYNYTLTDDEAATDYNDSLATHLGEGEQDLSYGLAGYWNFEEGSGQTAYDRSGNGNNATLGASSSVGTDDPVFVAGHDSTGDNGTGLKFDGVNDYADAGNGASLDISNNFSYSAWVKFDDLDYSGNTGTLHILGSKGEPDDDDPNAGWWIAFDNRSNNYDFQYTCFGNSAGGWSGGGNNFGDSQYSYQFANNVWYNITVTVSSNSTARLYIDGRKMGADKTLSNLVLSNTSYNLRHSFGPSSMYSKQNLDEVRVYNRALSEDEIRFLYNQKKPILEVSMNEGSGSIVHDDSFGNYDGTVYGATGTAESGGATTLTDTNKSWTTDEWSGETISIIYGIGVGQSRTVSSNTATAVTVSSAWTTNPDATSVYRITSKDEWGEGKNATAIGFDGIDDYADFGDVLDMGKNDMTISAWIKTNATTGNHYIVGKAIAASQNYRYGSGVQDSKLKIFMQGDDPGSDVSFMGNMNVSDGLWHFASFVFDRDGNASIYVDGKYDNSASISHWSDLNMNSDNPLRIGSSATIDNTSAYSLFDGSIDDVRVYNYIRTQEEILTDYNAGKSVKLGANSQDINSGLVGYWNFEEGAGQTVYDSSGNSNNGTLGTSSSVGSDDPVFGSGYGSSGNNGTGLKFDGADDYAKVNAANLDLRAVTVSMWVNSNKSSGLGMFRTDASNNILLHYRGAGFYLTASDSTVSGYLGWNNLPDYGRWTFLTATWDGSLMRLYTDGVKQSSTLSFSGGTTGIVKSGTYYSMGKRFNDGQNWFDGSIDEVRVYDRALSDDEIRMLYNQKKPIMHLKMDEGSGSVAHDESFNNNDGTITGATWISGKSGNALSFDGSGDYVDLGNSSVFDVTNNVTFGAWIKANGISTDRDIIGKQDSYLFRFSAASPGKLQLILKSGSNWNFSNYSFNRVDDGAWHYVAGVYDGSNMRIYVDGEIGAIDTVFSSNIAVTTNNVFVGARSTGLEYFFGQIDEARVYNYARTAEEIKTDYNSGVAVRFR